MNAGLSTMRIGEVAERASVNVQTLRYRRNPSRSGAAVRAVAVRRAADIADRIRRLAAMQKALEQLVTACECAGASRVCPIIEALDEESPTTPPPST